jgi:hypothetical protein
MTAVSYGASGRAWSDALMIVGRLSADPAIGGSFGYDSAPAKRGETGYNLKHETGNSNY